MKFKTFILTFIMIMSSPFLFGHQNISNYDWDNVASLQDNAKMSTQFQSGDNTRSGSDVVAKIGDDIYPTLKAAFEAAAQATEATTITLLSDITIESDLNNGAKGYFNVSDGKNVTLDLGYKTITVTDNSTGNFILFYNYGEFTMKNGTVELTATIDRDWNAQSTIVLNRGGIFSCESGTYTHKGGSDMSFVFDNSGNYYGDATMNIGVQQRSTDAPVLTSSYIAIRNRMEQNSHGASGTAYLNVYGGTISGTSRAIWAQAASASETAPATGEINVEGGNIGLIDTPRGTGAVSMTTISGGTVAAFKGEVGELQVVAPGEITGEVTMLTPEGEPADYIIDENGNYIAPTIVEVGSQEVLQSAINNSQSGEVITLTESIELSSTIIIPADKFVTLDLNGKKISKTFEENKADDLIVNKGSLVITDNTDTKAGVVTYKYTGQPDSNYSYDNATIQNEGTLTIIAGKIENTTAAMSHASYAINTNAGATLNIEGGNVLNLNGHAIRMVSFGTVQNTVNVSGGYIEGVRALQVQFPGSAGSPAKPAMDINISGGELKSNETTYNLAIYVYSDGQSAENLIDLEISGDAVINGNVALNATATNTMQPNTAIVSGGTINGEYGIFSYADSDDHTQSVIKITGGTFATNYSEWYAYDDGFKFVENADGTYGVVQQGAVAQIVGGQGYPTLQEAINAVEDNQTIKLLYDNNENIVAGNENQKPFNKIFTIDGNNFNVTGKWHFGRDDRNQDNSEITVINTNFSVKGISIDDFKSVTINECTFKNITEGNGIYVAADEFTSQIIVENCEIENVAGAGINFRNPVKATITGNTIKNTGGNAITFQHGTAYTEAETGTYIIKNNVFENWANNATEGRAIRIATGEASRSMTIEENAMINTNAPEEFVKITGNTDNVSIDKNYWNGANPIDEHTPAYYLVEDITPNDYYQDYSVENGLQNLLPTRTPVAQIGDTPYTTLEEAVEAVENNQTITMIDDCELSTNITFPKDKIVILDLNGKKITYTSTTQDEAMITNRGNLTINDGDSKDEMGEIYYNYTGAADPSHGKGNYTISNGGTLTVNGGKIHIAKLSQHAKYPIDNNSTSGDAILIINDGHLYNYNTSAIRQFCNSTTNKNSVTINGGLIEGYCAIWMQNPGKNTVNGQLAINNGEIRTTAKAYVEGTSPISEVSSEIYFTIYGEGGAWDENSAVAIDGGIINENVCLNNETPASVTLNKEATYNGSIKLYDGGQFVHNGLRNVTITKPIEGTTENGWYTISSPVGTVNHTNVDGLLNGTHDLYRYNEAAALWENVKVTENNFTTLEAGRGYIYANTAETTLSFTGDLVVETVEQDITATDNEYRGFNLIGNPFTQNITLDNISGAELAEGFYTLTKEGAWNANNSNTGVIGALQGALIMTTETNKVQINPTASKSRGVNNGQLKIKVANSKYNDVAYVSFNKGIGLDKINHRNADIPMVFVPVNGTNYAVAVMSNDVTEIPVSFVAKTMGEYTIGVEAQDCEFAQMTLIDKMTGYSTNLLLEDYTFIATSKDNADRFIIRLMSSFDHSFGVDNFVIFNNNEMIINDVQGEGVIRIVDVLGRPVAEYNVFGSANISTTSFRSGVYMIQVIDDNGVKVQKIIID